MKLITAVLQPQALSAVRQALELEGIHGLTVTEARRFGQQRGRGEVYRGEEFAADFVPKLKLEIVTGGEGLADRAVDAILRAASRGRLATARFGSLRLTT